MGNMPGKGNQNPSKKCRHGVCFPLKVLEQRSDMIKWSFEKVNRGHDVEDAIKGEQSGSGRPVRRRFCCYRREEMRV